MVLVFCSVSVFFWVFPLGVRVASSQRFFWDNSTDRIGTGKLYEFFAVVFVLTTDAGAGDYQTSAVPGGPEVW